MLDLDTIIVLVLLAQCSGQWSMQDMLETWVRIPCEAGVAVVLVTTVSQVINLMGAPVRAALSRHFADLSNRLRDADTCMLSVLGA